jgi:hypothetical protein
MPSAGPLATCSRGGRRSLPSRMPDVCSRCICPTSRAHYEEAKHNAIVERKSQKWRAVCLE